MKKTSLIAIAAAAAAAFATNASAADLGGDCCADLEERIAELEATTARKGNRKVSLTVSGWVNEAVMFWDDGVESNIYQVTNMTAQTRFRFVGSAKINDEWSAGYLIEIGVAGARSDQVTANNDDGTAVNSLGVRHSAWWINSKRLGKVWVGQTSAATDSIMEINVANTGHFANQNLQSLYGAFQVNSNVGTLGPLRSFMGGVAPFTTTGAQPGEGERHNVVKYETPTIQGFTLSAAYGEDDLWDVALRYAGEFNGIKMAFGVGYSQWTEGTNDEYACINIVNPDVSCSQFGVSGAVMHVPTGLFIHAAYGVRSDDNAPVGVDDETSQLYIQAGIERKFFPLGKTTLFGDYQNFDNGPLVNELTMWGFGINQNIEAAAMDIYLRYSNLEPDFNVVGVNEEGFQAVLMGAKINF